MKVTVIGTGYVGLVSGACFSEFGIQVTCVDKDHKKISSLKRGIIPIYEASLDQLVKKNFHAGRLQFTTNINQALFGADIVFISVGTPRYNDRGCTDLSYVFEAAEEIGKTIQSYTIVATKSTVPIGTGRKIAEIICKVNPKANFDIVSNPEFLREGSAIEDFMSPDRIIIGCSSKRAEDLMLKLYRPLFSLEVPIVITSLESAELIKQASNAFLATKVAFINEIADLCEKTGANIQDVSKGMGLDKRIGDKFLYPGPGYGGSCFPKDTLELVATAKNFEVPVSIVQSVIMSNVQRKKNMIQKIINVCDGVIKGKILTVLGVTFKPNTDDIRDSPSLDIIPGLQKEGAIIHAFDPKGRYKADSILSNVVWFEEPYKAMNGTDAVIILTEWNEFKSLNLNYMKKILKKPLIIDLRNIYTLKEMSNAGFEYVSVGRQIISESPKKILAVAS